MMRGDIIRMAIEAEFHPAEADCHYERLQRFAALVAQQEREACICACKSVISPQMIAECDWSQEGIAAAEGCIDAIRARAAQTVKQSLTVADAVAAEREACLAEIETGIWIGMTTDEILASIAAAIRARGAKDALQTLVDNGTLDASKVQRRHNEQNIGSNGCAK